MSEPFNKIGPAFNAHLPIIDPRAKVLDEVGLSKTQDSDVTNHCQDRWNLIYPNLSDADKQKTVAYCDCAKPKLMALIKQSDNMTDKQYDESIDGIAADCSSSALVNKPTATTSAPVTTTN